MQAVGVVHAANHGHVMHDLGRVGQMFTHLDAGYRGGNRFEFSAHLLGCIRFHVEGIEVTGPPVVENHDAGSDF